MHYEYTVHDIRFYGQNFHETSENCYLKRTMYNQSKHCHSDIILLTPAYHYSIKLQ